jgi:hypothetical protein
VGGLDNPKTMKKRQSLGSQSAVLTGVSLVGLVYIVWLSRQVAWLGGNRLDGALGVLLGLYICSHPAGNFLDLLLFKRNLWVQDLTSRRLSWWVGFNLVVIFIGWLVIYTGLLHFPLS